MPTICLQEWACGTMMREELEYSLASDETPYVAAAQSRFANPEIIACVADVVRRMHLLVSTRAAVTRKGFEADILSHKRRRQITWQPGRLQARSQLPSASVIQQLAKKSEQFCAHFCSPLRLFLAQRATECNCDTVALPCHCFMGLAPCSLAQTLLTPGLP